MPSPNPLALSKGALSRKVLRERVLLSLERQGFRLEDLARGTFLRASKEQIRSLHSEAREAQVARARSGLQRHESRLLAFFANGRDLNLLRIQPRLHEVKPGTEEERLFRYAKLHWSIPVSAGYGRRLRFLLFDDSNGKLIGILGLSDPVFALKTRDAWIGWTKEVKAQRLRHVMDAFVLGAVPPYSYLLYGKFIALLATSREVRESFSKKYCGAVSKITGRSFDGHLALLTTTSALGRSSLYRRLRIFDRHAFISVGYTAGSGEFHFANGLYRELSLFAKNNCVPTAKHELWGSGWRSRRELIRYTLPQLGLSRDLIYHGVRREVFLAPHASNAAAFLRGETSTPQYYTSSIADLYDYFRERWLIPRARTETRQSSFEAGSLRLWRPSENSAPFLDSQPPRR